LLLIRIGDFQDRFVFLTLDPGFGTEKFGSRIWDKNPGSATLTVYIIKLQNTSSGISLTTLLGSTLQKYKLQTQKTTLH
jgi:hypothetical protein